MQVYSFKLEGGGASGVEKKRKKQHRFKFEDVFCYKICVLSLKMHG
jgi:hypothetical protein